MLNRNTCGAPRTLSLFGQRSPTSPRRKFTVRRGWNRTNVSNIQNTGVPVQIAGGRRQTVQSAFPPPPFTRPCPAGDSSSILFRSAQRRILPTKILVGLVMHETLDPHAYSSIQPAHGSNAGVTEVPRRGKQPDSLKPCLTRGACHCPPMSSTFNSLNWQPTDSFRASSHVHRMSHRSGASDHHSKL
jgi:hypothetical protein